MHIYGSALVLWHILIGWYTVGDLVAVQSIIMTLVRRFTARLLMDMATVTQQRRQPLCQQKRANLKITTNSNTYSNITISNINQSQIMQRLSDLPREICDLFPPSIHYIAVVQFFHQVNSDKFKIKLRLPKLKFSSFIADLEFYAGFSSKAKPHGSNEVKGVKVVQLKEYVCVHAPHESGQHLSKAADAKDGEVAKRKTVTKDGSPLQSKCINCPAKFQIKEFPPLDYGDTAKSRWLAKRRVENDPLIVDFPTEFTMIWHHTHQCDSLASLRYRKISNDTREKLVEFLDNHQGSVAAAMTAYNNWLQEMNLTCLGSSYQATDNFVLRGEIGITSPQNTS